MRGESRENENRMNLLLFRFVLKTNYTHLQNEPKKKVFPKSFVNVPVPKAKRIKLIYTPASKHKKLP